MFLCAIGDNMHIKLMRKRRLWRSVQTMLLMAVLFVIGGAGPVFAETSNSQNYQVTESQFGVGSSMESCSAQYCARATMGDMAGGTSESAGTKATFGPITPDEPLLEVIVQDGESNLGILSTDKTSTKTTIIQIRNYLSDGYTLQIMGDPPKYNGHSLKTSNTPVAAQPGTEQFGINVAKNTAPEVGADPIQIPSSQISFGQVTDAYRTPNLFKFTSGDVVARSDTESGRTDYTISMIVNVSNSTPAGHYSGDFSAVVIPIF